MCELCDLELNYLNLFKLWFSDLEIEGISGKHLVDSLWEVNETVSNVGLVQSQPELPFLSMFTFLL